MPVAFSFQLSASASASAFSLSFSLSFSFSFSLDLQVSGAFPQGVAHVKIKKTLATPQTRVPSSLPPEVNGTLFDQLESPSSMCTWWNT